MSRTVQQPPARTGPAPKPKPEPRTKRLDLDLLAIARQRKLDAGILPGVPFH
jgi:hypothetical protein